MSRFVLGILILATAAVIPARLEAQSLVSRFEVANLVFSPDGDSVEDTTNVYFILRESALSVSLVVFEADSITPVDTLLAPQTHPAARSDRGWDGLAWDGSPAPDASYIVALTADDTTATRRVVVDRGAPSFVYIEVTPSPYGPGAPGSNSDLSVGFEIAGTSPLYSGIPVDEVQHRFVKLAGNTEIEPDSIRFDPDYDGTDGVYALLWHGEGQADLTDGEYLVTLTAVDQAGHSTSRDHTFFIDAKPPELKVTLPLSGRAFRQPPDSLAAWARDLSAMDSLLVRYSATGPYTEAVIDRVSADTTFFYAPLADSLAAEGTYTLTVRAVDGVGRAATSAVTVVIDRTTPEAPQLDPFNGVWRTDSFRVTGTFPSGGGTAARVRIYRNGAPVDSVVTFDLDDIDRVIGLEPGENVIYATFVDGAGNESAPSNEIVVNFDDGSGLFFPAPVRPGDAFKVNLAETGTGVKIYIYDMTGDLVVMLENRSALTSYSVEWNGLNGSGELVKKGPLLVVAVATAGGTRKTFRELFLFEPNTE